VKIRLRYNKDRKGIEDAWRVFVGDIQYNVRDFTITVPVESSTTFERGEMKWNVSCEGELEIRDGRAYIR